MTIEPARGRMRPIIILGVDRSGTSLVASMVAQWGAFGGEVESLQDGDSGNPTGYWEYGELKPFNNELLEGERVSHWHPMFRMMVKERALERPVREKAEKLVQGMETAGGPWFWKEPDLSLTLSFWKQFWTDPLYVVTVRNPHDTAVSWKKFILPKELHDKYSLMTANLLRWQYYLVSILTEVDPSPHKIFVQYEDLMSNPKEQAAKLDKFLAEGCGLEPGDEARLDRMSGRIDTELWRNKSPTPLNRVPQASKEQKALYELLKRKVARPAEPFVPAAFPLGAGYWEYLELVDTIL